MRHFWRSLAAVVAIAVVSVVVDRLLEVDRWLVIAAAGVLAVGFLAVDHFWLEPRLSPPPTPSRYVGAKIDDSSGISIGRLEVRGSGTALDVSRTKGLWIGDADLEERSRRPGERDDD